MDYIRLGFKRWLDIAGRSSRAEYVIFTAMVFLAVGITVLIGRIFGETAGAVVAIPMFFLVIATCIPHFTLTIRRLHDLGLPGFLVVVAYFIPLLNLVMVAALATIPGRDEDNKYGGSAGVPADYLGKI